MPIFKADVIVDWLLLVRQHMKAIMAEWEATDLTSARHDVFGKYLATKYPRV
jgi:hypothetical protein